MAKSWPKRWLVAFDGHALHVREIQCIHHDNISGEVRYACTPMSNRRLQKAIRQVVIQNNLARIRKASR